MSYSKKEKEVSKENLKFFEGNEILVEKLHKEIRDQLSEGIENWMFP